MRQTRRTALAGLALAAHSVGQEKSSDYIDAHIHVWTPDVTHFPRVAGERNYKPDSFTPEELWANAKPCGVSRVVLVQMSFYGTDNAYMLDAIKRYPGSFAGVGMVASEAPGVQAEMLRLLSHHIRGYRISPASGGSGLDTPGMRAMWQCGAENRIAMCPLIDPCYLPSVYKMCGKFPDTPVVIDHMARIGADGTVRDADVHALCGLARHKNVHVKVSAFYALGKKQYPYTDLIPMIRALYDSFGPQRLMWASDSPFQVLKPHTYAGSLELVRDRLDFLSKEDHEWLLRKSAEKVFFTRA